MQLWRPWSEASPDERLKPSRAVVAGFSRPTGLTSEILRSDTLASGLFTRVRAWLLEHKLT
jgi:hypothetical protein